jgi:hypothetical protein
LFSPLRELLQHLFLLLFASLVFKRVQNFF